LGRYLRYFGLEGKHNITKSDMNKSLPRLMVEECILMFEKWMETKNGSKMDGG